MAQHFNIDFNILTHELFSCCNFKLFFTKNDSISFPYLKKYMVSFTLEYCVVLA